MEPREGACYAAINEMEKNKYWLKVMYPGKCPLRTKANIHIFWLAETSLLTYSNELTNLKTSTNGKKYIYFPKKENKPEVRSEIQNEIKNRANGKDKWTVMIQSKNMSYRLYFQLYRIKVLNVSIHEVNEYEV